MKRSASGPVYPPTRSRLLLCNGQFSRSAYRGASLVLDWHLLAGTLSPFRLFLILQYSEIASLALPIHFSSRRNSFMASVRKNFGAFGAGCPSGLSKPLAVRIGISCGEKQSSP